MNEELQTFDGALRSLQPQASLEEETALAELQARLFRRNRRPIVGRYVLHRRLGEGGMGVVFAAHDAELERHVAIKLLRRGNGITSSVERLAREAEVLAQLDHPNIVRVYDVGQYRPGALGSARTGAREFGAFVVMELLSDGDLRAWLRERRSASEIMERFVAAGRGLAAAHEHGIVHRDFKPANVLLGAGRVKVVDFGLARSFGDDAAETGIAVGTPAYMPPEQRRGGPVDARADQYSFCVSLTEALLDADALAGLPRRVRRALDRGAHVDPAKRFDSMQDFLAELQPSTSRVGPVAVAAFGIGTTLTAVAPPAEPRAGSCLEDVAARASVMWNENVRSSVGASLSPTARGSSVVEKLDAYARRWVASAEGLCRATESSGACLEERALEFEALVRLLEHPAPKLAAQVPGLVARLEEPGACADGPLPPRRSDIETKLAEARIHQLAARYDDALALARDARSMAERVGDETAVADATLREAYVLGITGHAEQSRPLLEDSYFVAVERGHARVAATAAALLVRLSGPGDLANARRWDERARSSLSQTSGNTPLEEMIEHNLGMVLKDAGRIDEAEPHMRRALELRRARDVPADSRLATYIESVGDMYLSRDRLDPAMALFEEAFQIRTKVLGATHPDLATTLERLATVEHARGNLTTALAHFEHSLRVREAGLDDGNPLIAVSRTNVGSMLSELGRHEAALAHLEAASKRSRAGGLSPTLSIQLELELARGYLAAGRKADAATVLTAARDTAGAKLGYAHPLTKLAETLLDQARARRTSAE